MRQSVLDGVRGAHTSVGAGLRLAGRLIFETGSKSRRRSACRHRVRIDSHPAAYETFVSIGALSRCIFVSSQSNHTWYLRVPKVLTTSLSETSATYPYPGQTIVEDSVSCGTSPAKTAMTTIDSGAERFRREIAEGRHISGRSGAGPDEEPTSLSVECCILRGRSPKPEGQKRDLPGARAPHAGSSHR